MARRSTSPRCIAGRSATARRSRRTSRSTPPRCSRRSPANPASGHVREVRHRRLVGSACDTRQMLDISCAFATSMATPDHVAHAEALGFRRAWLYDSPALYPDVWMALAECARRTSTIELGPGVAIPSLRHPMVTAAAVATLCELAPGRVNLAVGSGFTGRLTLGQKPLSWTYVRDYVEVVVELLAGGTPLWDGARI